MVDQPRETGPWDPALAKLSEWDPAWAATCMKMTTNPWTAGVLPRKFVELVSVGLNAAPTDLNPDGTRRHIRAALAAGATREGILFVLKCASVMSIHSCSLGAPILLEEAKAAGPKPAPKNAAATDRFMATGGAIYSSGVMPPKEVELLSIALDGSHTHMYAPGTRRHIKGGLKAGATMEEIMEVLRLCVVQGVQACNLGVPILAEEIAAVSKAVAQP
jgi:alkylhydroperoxidase/carboxymuconolactone decarboxylase family protein YurZ